MSFAKPLLVSNAIAQKKLVTKKHSGLVHNEKDSVDFSLKVIQLYEDKGLREKLGKNGEDFIKNEFSWEITCQKLLNLYNNLQV